MMSVDGDLLVRAPDARAELLLVADDAVDLGHGGKTRGFRLRGATGHHDARMRAVRGGCGRMLWRAWRTASAVTAQVFTTTASSRPAAARLAADDFRLERVQPAAEGDDIDAHGAGALSNSAASKRPLNSNSTGPVISTWSSLLRHSMVSSPPASDTLHLALGAPQPRGGDRGGAGRRAAGLGEPGAAFPGADDDVLADRQCAPA